MADDDAHAEHRGDDAGHAEGADVDAASVVAAHPAIRKPAARDGAEDGRALPPDDGAHTGDALLEIEFLGEEGGHPVAHDPPGHGGQGEVEDKQDEGAVGKEFFRGRAEGILGGGGFTGFCLRRVAQEPQQGQGVEDADDAGEVEGASPAESRRVGDVAGEAADDDATIDADLVQSDGAGAGVAGVEIRDEGEGGGDVEGFAHAHEGARPEEAVVGGDVAGGPGDGGPDEEAGADDAAFAETVGEPAADGAEDGVDPLELAEHESPVGLGADAGDVVHHRELHGGDHLAVEVVEQRDGDEQGDDEPAGAGGRRGVHVRSVAEGCGGSSWHDSHVRLPQGITDHFVHCEFGF
jgi:hypothetical protein